MMPLVGGRVLAYGIPKNFRMAVVSGSRFMESIGRAPESRAWASALVVMSPSREASIPEPKGADSA
jgi:hypothetical protein